MVVGGVRAYKMFFFEKKQILKCFPEKFFFFFKIYFFGEGVGGGGQ